MTLDELIKVVSNGERLEVFDRNSKNCENPFTSEFFKDWHYWEVKCFYSIFNDSKKDTKTHIEVERIY